MAIKKSQDIDLSNNEEQYETGNEGAKSTKSNKIGGEDGSKLDTAMKRKYPSKNVRHKEYR